MKISNDTVAVVTGAARGIGLACARVLLDRGARVFLLDNDHVELQSSCDVLQNEYGKERVFSYTVNVLDEAEMEEVFNAATQITGSVDIVINNAGVADHTPITDPACHGSALPVDWSNTLNVNLVAVINGSRLAVKHMSTTTTTTISSSHRGGVILNISSMGGLYPMPHHPVYAATKAAVVAFSRSLHHLSSSHGIRVNAICPAFTDTVLGRAGIDSLARPADSSIIPLLTVNQVANVVLMVIENDDLAGDVISISTQMGVCKHLLVPYDKTFPLNQAIQGKL